MAFLKMGADLAAGNWNSAKENGVEALTMLIGFKGGESVLGRTQFALKIKQMAFDIQRLTQGIISKSPLEFLTKGADGLERAIIKDSVLDPANPAGPPVEVTKILTPEELAKQNEGDLYMAPNGQVIKGACFNADTLVLTRKGFAPIVDIKVGDEVLSRSEITGEQAYRKVTNRFVHKNWAYMVSFSVTDGSNNDIDFVDATSEHPFWVNGVGWVPTCELKIGQEVEIVDPDANTDLGYLGKDVATLDRIRLSGQRRTARIVRLDPRGKIVVPVFNLEVEEFHTYFVGHYGVWVHNTKDHFAGGSTQPIVFEKVTPDAKPLVVFQRDASPTPAKLGEYEFIDSLAQHGLDVVQLADSPANILGKNESTRRPDALANGRTIDAYTPQPGALTSTVKADILDSIRSNIFDKTLDQSSDIGLNLREYPDITVQDIYDALSQNPVDGLSHLYILKDGVMTFREYKPNGTNNPTYGYVDSKSGSYIRADGTSKGYVGDPSKRYGAYNLEVSAEGITTNVVPLAEADINTLLPAARQYWLNAGASAAVLDATQISIGSLPAGVAGQTQGTQITLSADGAGWGWFVDTTPAVSEEFTLQSGGILRIMGDRP